MRTFTIHAGDRVAVNRHFSVKISRVDGNQVQLELGELNGHAVDHIEITHFQPTKHAQQPASQKANGQRAKHNGQPAKQAGKPNNRKGNGPNPYAMGKPQRNGNQQSRNPATAKNRK